METDEVRKGGTGHSGMAHQDNGTGDCGATQSVTWGTRSTPTQATTQALAKALGGRVGARAEVC